jgi:mevalonate kinase
MITASAPAKIILFGEHAVVYGVPAIAIPVPSLRAIAEASPAPVGQGLQIHAADKGITLPVTLAAQAGDALVETARLVIEHLAVPAPDLTISLHSSIPMASGLGSGAAVSTALARALAIAVEQPLPDEALNVLIYEIEKRHHGTPSGIDNTVIVYERPVFFVRGEPIQSLTVGGAFHFVIGDTGISASTRIAVEGVRALYDEKGTFVESVLEEIRAIVGEARQALETGDSAAIGRLMIANHALLQSLAVSSPELDMLVSAALEAGALGAKLSGGGRGGNMIALVTPETSKGIAEALLAAGARRVFETALMG